MSTTLFNYEWEFLVQMITRVQYCETYNDTCSTFLEQIRTLIPYNSGVAFQAGRERGRAVLSNTISTEQAGPDPSHDFFIEGRYPHWDEFIMSPFSTVFRQSDIIPPGKWEKTRVYRDVWQPKGLYWGVFVSLVHKDVPLSIIGIQREKASADFSARELYIINTLKDPLERKFFSLLENRNLSSDVGAVRLLKTASAYGLTKRETDIVTLVYSGKSGSEICQSLYITHATLSKHLSNIYAKTNVKNRTQLLVLFQ